MRYTECRLTRASMAILADLDKDTVDFKENYDGKETRAGRSCPRASRTCWSTAQAVSPWAWRPIFRRIIWAKSSTPAWRLSTTGHRSWKQLLDIVPGPDFPTGGEIIGRTGARQALMTGRGSVVVRGVATIEEIRKDREAIIITAIPYQVNKAAMVERIAELVREKRIEGIAEMRDESDRTGHARRDRAQARRQRRGGPQPALSIHRRCRAPSRSIRWRSIAAGPSNWACARC